MNKVLSVKSSIFQKKISVGFLNKTSAQLLYSIIKSYADKILGYRSLRKHFYSKMGYELDLKNPTSFNHKINWKKVFDRNPLLILTADKYAARGYVEKILGFDEASKILIPLYSVTEDAESIPFDELPENFVVKPNHGCKMHLFVRGDKLEQKEKIICSATKWLKMRYGLYNYEWAYRHIKPKILVEQLLETPDGSLPLDYKFYCFRGKCKLIRVSENRFTDGDSSCYFDLNWNRMPIHNPGYNDSTSNYEKPANLTSLIAVAEKLSVEFDAVRIDLFNIDGQVYFGEFTHYDAAGLARFEPESFDFSLGANWEIQHEYWKNKDAG
jgi:hypothetical protein